MQRVSKCANELFLLSKERTNAYLNAANDLSEYFAPNECYPLVFKILEDKFKKAEKEILSKYGYRKYSEFREELADIIPEVWIYKLGL
jgi:hypothetical protein